MQTSVNAEIYCLMPQTIYLYAMCLQARPPAQTVAHSPGSYLLNAIRNALWPDSHRPDPIRLARPCFSPRIASACPAPHFTATTMPRAPLRRSFHRSHGAQYAHPVQWDMLRLLSSVSLWRHLSASTPPPTCTQRQYLLALVARHFCSSCRGR